MFRAVIFLSVLVITGAYEKPNIILIMADDLGWADINPNDPSNTNTPNIERLARNGLRYTDYHSAASVCTPSRAGLLTGRMGQRTGVLQNFNPSSLGGLPTTENTLADYLKTVGYATGIVGKWHLGHTSSYHPLSRGFDYYYGLPYSNDMGCLTCSPIYDIRSSPMCPNHWEIGVPLYENRVIIEQPVDLTTLSARYVEKSKAFISQAVEKSAPFFLYVPLAHAHVPLATGKKFYNSSSDGHFGDVLREMDHFVGEIVNFTQKINIDDRTIIIFTSDNGPWEVKCYLAGNAAPYTGAWQRNQRGGGGGSASKFTTWEGGHRVPFIISWPNIISPGVSSELVSGLDLVPTFAEIANFTLPNDREYDGVRFPFLGNTSNTTRALFFQDIASEDIWAMRYGKYKVVYGSNRDPDSLDCNDYIGKGFLYHNPALIFDTLEDPSESRPLSLGLDFYRNIEDLMTEKRKNFLTTFHSKVNWKNDKNVRPCCNPKNDYCSCKIPSQTYTESGPEVET